MLLIDIADHSWGNGEDFNRKGKDRDSRQREQCKQCGVLTSISAFSEFPLSQSPQGPWS